MTTLHRAVLAVWLGASAVIPIGIDANGLTFIDSSGLMALVRARDAATESGVAFRVSEPSPPLCRIAGICGLEGLLLDG